MAALTVDDVFLPGLPRQHILDQLAAAGGNEVDSGKFAHPESSAALAVNAFGWFIERPNWLPPLPGTAHAGRSETVEVEYCARFPWSAGRHPWLDAAIFTSTHLIGVESKRFEPFRDKEQVSFSVAYDKPVWGENMQGFCRLRDALRSGDIRFQHLDAAQLVKHAYGLVTDAGRLKRRPLLFYLFAEPPERAGRVIAAEHRLRHRAEISMFASAVSGDEVEFCSASYREWLGSWPSTGDVRRHADALVERFNP
jgi:hypothetical protein